MISIGAKIETHDLQHLRQLAGVVGSNESFVLFDSGFRGPGKRQGDGQPATHAPFAMFFWTMHPAWLSQACHYSHHRPRVPIHQSITCFPCAPFEPTLQVIDSARSRPGVAVVAEVVEQLVPGFKGLAAGLAGAGHCGGPGGRLGLCRGVGRLVD